MHVEQVLGDVAPEDRCQCHADGSGVAPFAGVGRFWSRLTKKG